MGRGGREEPGTGGCDFPTCPLPAFLTPPSPSLTLSLFSLFLPLSTWCLPVGWNRALWSLRPLSPHRSWPVHRSLSLSWGSGDRFPQKQELQVGNSRRARCVGWAGGMLDSS